MSDCAICAIEEVAEPIAGVWQRLLSPLLVRLDAQLDRRLVATLSDAVRAIVQHRHRNHGLLLSELGAYLLSAAQAPAGTKRLSNLLRSSKWCAQDVAQHLWQQAATEVAHWHSVNEEVLALWDESVLEKPESQAAQGLSPVRSSKAARLSRLKPGYYRPPTAPVFVPGLHWMALLFIGRSGPPCVAAMKWWGTRSTVTSVSTSASTSASTHEPWLQERSEIKKKLLEQCQQELGRLLLHIFDRGFAGAPWLSELHSAQARFVLRWPKHYKLCDQQGQERKAWQHLRGQRSWEHKLLPDAKRRQMRKTGVVAVPVFHAAYGAGQEPLWLVASRPGKGREPWYLLTNEPVENAEAAWRVVQAYARRWQIEMSLRFNKSELALESPRLWSWERRLKLLMIVTLAYAFLLALLRLPREQLQAVLRRWCHRTGKRSRETPTPLYRLRLALSRLFAAHPPNFSTYQSSG